MEYICLDLEGVLVPEIWSEVAKFSGDERLNLTTQDIKNYQELMDMRIEIVNELKISTKDIYQLVENMEPLKGAREFLDWARDSFQVVIVSDSFYQLAWPLIKKLGTPSLICHHLDIEGNKLKGYRLRQEENKMKVVKALKILKYKVFAAGDSYNDIQMFEVAEKGFFMNAPEKIAASHPDIPSFHNYDDLENAILKSSIFVK